MRSFPHPIVLQQASNPNPDLLALLFIIFVPTWIPTLFTAGLSRWSVFVDFTSHYQVLYLLAFLCFQTGLILGAVGFLNLKYRSALWTPEAQFDRRRLLALWFLLPVLLFHLLGWIPSIRALSSLLSFSDQNHSKEVIDTLHTSLWGRFYGSSLTGVIGTSVLSFLSPILEEMTFTGLLANILMKSFGVSAALIWTPLCFTFAHALQYGVDLHLALFFVVGFTYILIRFWSGSLLLSVMSHLFINFIIILPKWAVALAHFSFS